MVNGIRRNNKSRSAHELIHIKAHRRMKKILENTPLTPQQASIAWGNITKEVTQEAIEIMRMERIARGEDPRKVYAREYFTDDSVKSRIDSHLNQLEC